MTLGWIGQFFFCLDRLYWYWMVSNVASVTYLGLSWDIWDDLDGWHLCPHGLSSSKTSAQPDPRGDAH